MPRHAKSEPGFSFFNWRISGLFVIFIIVKILES